MQGALYFWNAPKAMAGYKKNIILNVEDGNLGQNINQINLHPPRPKAKKNMQK